MKNFSSCLYLKKKKITSLVVRRREHAVFSRSARFFLVCVKFGFLFLGREIGGTHIPTHIAGKSNEVQSGLKQRRYEIECLLDCIRVYGNASKVTPRLAVNIIAACLSAIDKNFSCFSDN